MSFLKKVTLSLKVDLFAFFHKRPDWLDKTIFLTEMEFVFKSFVFLYDIASYLLFDIYYLISFLYLAGDVPSIFVNTR